MKKDKQMRDLLNDLRKEDRVNNIIVKRKGIDTDVSMVNQFALHDFIPNKWFDWERRAKAKIMIIGQDWGPYVALKEYFDDYEVDSKHPDFDYDKFLFKGFSSRTEKFWITAIKNTYKEHYDKDIPEDLWKEFIFTVAVLFTRKGIHFRGNHNFDEKIGMEISYPYLSRQIDIVQPKIIMPFGNMAWQQIRRHFKLEDLSPSMTQIFKDFPEGYIKIKDTYIIPNFHPASYIDPQIMINRYKKIWMIINKNL